MSRGFIMQLTGIGAIATTLLAAGCGDDGDAAAERQRSWVACRMITDDAVAETFGVESPEALTISSGLGDVDWNLDEGPGGSLHSVAVSRCTYGVESGAPPRVLDLVARVSGRFDRNERQTRALLEQQGFQTTSVELECSEGALWVPGELHAFTSIPNDEFSEACEGTGDTDAPLFAHLVLRLDVGAREASTRQKAIELMGVVLPLVRADMADLPTDHTDADQPDPEPQFVDAGATIAPEEFPAVAASLQCERLAECCEGASEGAVSELSGDPTCTALLAASYGAVFFGVSDAVERGTVSYSSSAAASCFEQFESASCGQLTSGSAEVPCLQAFTPQAENGATCISDLECRSGYCAPSSGALAPADAGPVATTPEGGAMLGNSPDAGAGPFDAGVAELAQGLDAGPGPLAERDSGYASDAGAAQQVETTGLCDEPGVLGEQCDRDSGCESGRCQAGRCVASSNVPWCSGI